MDQRQVEEVVRKCDDAPSKWCVYSKKGKKLGGPYDTEGEANKRLGQIEFFKKQKGAMEALAAREGMTLEEVLSTSDYEMLTDTTADKGLVPNQPAVTTDEGDYPEAGEETEPGKVPGPRTCVCPECGTKLEKEEESQTPCQELKCPKCGAQMQAEGEEAEEVEAFRVQEWRYGAPDAILPDGLETLADQELSGQPFGSIMRVDEYPELSALTPNLDYEGRRWTATRRQVDQLDQVTFGRKRKNIGQLPEYVNEVSRVRQNMPVHGVVSVGNYEPSGGGFTVMVDGSPANIGVDSPSSLFVAFSGRYSNQFALGLAATLGGSVSRRGNHAIISVPGSATSPVITNGVIGYMRGQGGQAGPLFGAVADPHLPVQRSPSRTMEQVRVRTPDGIGILDSLGPSISTVYFPDKRTFQQYPNSAIGVIGAELREAGVFSTYEYDGFLIEVREQGHWSGSWQWRVVNPPIGIPEGRARGYAPTENLAWRYATVAIDNFEHLMSARRSIETAQLTLQQALDQTIYVVRFLDDQKQFRTDGVFNNTASAVRNARVLGMSFISVKVEGLDYLFDQNGVFQEILASARPVTEHVHRCHSCGQTVDAPAARAGGKNRPPAGWAWYIERGKFHHKYCDRCIARSRTKGVPFKPYKYYTQPYGRYRETMGMADRDRLRTKQDELLTLARQLNYDETLRIAENWPGAPLVGELRYSLFPEFEDAIDHAIAYMRRQIGESLPAPDTAAMDRPLRAQAGDETLRNIIDWMKANAQGYPRVGKLVDQAIAVSGAGDYVDSSDRLWLEERAEAILLDLGLAPRGLGASRRFVRSAGIGIPDPLAIADRKGILIYRGTRVRNIWTAEEGTVSGFISTPVMRPEESIVVLDSGEQWVVADVEVVAAEFLTARQMHEGTSPWFATVDGGDEFMRDRPDLFEAGSIFRAREQGVSISIHSYTDTVGLRGDEARDWLQWVYNQKGYGRDDEVAVGTLDQWLDQYVSSRGGDLLTARQMHEGTSPWFATVDGWEREYRGYRLKVYPKGAFVGGEKQWGSDIIRPTDGRTLVIAPYRIEMQSRSGPEPVKQWATDHVDQFMPSLDWAEITTAVQPSQATLRSRTARQFVRRSREASSAEVEDFMRSIALEHERPPGAIDVSSLASAAEDAYSLEPFTSWVRGLAQQIKVEFEAFGLANIKARQEQGQWTGRAAQRASREADLGPTPHSIAGWMKDQWGTLSPDQFASHHWGIGGGSARQAFAQWVKSKNFAHVHLSLEGWEELLSDWEQERNTGFAAALREVHYATILLGKVFGEDAALRVPERTSTADPPQASILMWGNSQVEIGASNLSARMYNLLPIPMANARGKDWEPFVQAALATGLLSSARPAGELSREAEIPEVKYKDKILFLDRWDTNQWLAGTVIQTIHDMNQMHFRSDVGSRPDHFVKISDYGTAWKLLGRQPTLLSDRARMLSVYESELPPLWTAKNLHLAIGHKLKLKDGRTIRVDKFGGPGSFGKAWTITELPRWNILAQDDLAVNIAVQLNNWGVEVLTAAQRPVQATWHVHEKRGGYGGSEFVVWYENAGYPFDRREFLPGNEDSALSYIEVLKGKGHVMATRDSTPIDYQELLDQKEFWRFGESRRPVKAAQSPHFDFARNVLFVARSFYGKPWSNSAENIQAIAQYLEVGTLPPGLDTVLIDYIRENASHYGIAEGHEARQPVGPGMALGREAQPDEMTWSVRNVSLAIGRVLELKDGRRVRVDLVGRWQIRDAATDQFIDEYVAAVHMASWLNQWRATIVLGAARPAREQYKLASVRPVGDRQAREAHQMSFNPVDFTFRWTDDWYEWDYSAAHQQAQQARNAKARELRSQGYKVRSWAMRNQRISRGGIGSGKPHIDLVVTVYMIDYREAGMASRRQVHEAQMDIYVWARSRGINPDISDPSRGGFGWFTNWLRANYPQLVGGSVPSTRIIRSDLEWASLWRDYIAGRGKQPLGIDHPRAFGSRRPARESMTLAQALKLNVHEVLYTDIFGNEVVGKGRERTPHEALTKAEQLRAGQIWVGIGLEWYVYDFKGQFKEIIPGSHYTSYRRRPAREQGSSSIFLADFLAQSDLISPNDERSFKDWLWWAKRDSGNTQRDLSEWEALSGEYAEYVRGGRVASQRPRFLAARNVQRGQEVFVQLPGRWGYHKARVTGQLLPAKGARQGRRSEYVIVEMASGGVKAVARELVFVRERTIRASSVMLKLAEFIEQHDLSDTTASSFFEWMKYHKELITRPDFLRSDDEWRSLFSEFSKTMNASAQQTPVMAAVIQGLDEWGGVRVGQTVSYHDGLRSHRAIVTGIAFTRPPHSSDMTPVYHIQYGGGKTARVYKDQIMRGVARRRARVVSSYTELIDKIRWALTGKPEPLPFDAVAALVGVGHATLHRALEDMVGTGEVEKFPPYNYRLKAAYTVELKVGDPVLIIDGSSKGERGVVTGDYVDTYMVEFPDGSRRRMSYRQLRLDESARRRAWEQLTKGYYDAGAYQPDDPFMTADEANSRMALATGHLPEFKEWLRSSSWRLDPNTYVDTADGWIRLVNEFYVEQNIRSARLSRTCGIDSPPVSLKAVALAFAQTAPDEWRAEHNGRIYYVYQAMQPEGTWGVEVFEGGAMVGEASGLTSFAGAKGWAESKAAGIVAGQRYSARRPVREVTLRWQREDENLYTGHTVRGPVARASRYEGLWSIEVNYLDGGWHAISETFRTLGDARRSAEKRLTDEAREHFGSARTSQKKRIKTAWHMGRGGHELYNDAGWKKVGPWAERDFRGRNFAVRSSTGMASNIAGQACMVYDAVVLEDESPQSGEWEIWIDGDVHAGTILKAAPWRY